MSQGISLVESNHPPKAHFFRIKIGATHSLTDRSVASLVSSSKPRIWGDSLVEGTDQSHFLCVLPSNPSPPRPLKQHTLSSQKACSMKCSHREHLEWDANNACPRSLDDFGPLNQRVCGKGDWPQGQCYQIVCGLDGEDDQRGDDTAPEKLWGWEDDLI